MRTARALAVPVIAAISLIAATGMAAPRQTAPQLSITAVDAEGYPELRAVVTALDNAGLPVNGLTAANFRAFEGGEPLTVADARNEQLDLAVAVVIDTSGSMQGQPMAAAQEAARQFIANLRPNDSAALFAFSSDVRQVVPFTTDKAAVTAGINGLQAVGDTALFSAAQVSVFATSSSDLPRRAVVLLSDGENAPRLGDETTAAGSIDVARTAGIPVYTIGFGTATDTTYLQALAEASQGQYRAATAGSVAEVYGDISRLLESQYTLVLRAPRPATSGGTSTLRIETDIAGEPAVAERQFERPAPAVPTVGPQNTTVSEEDGGSSSTPLLAVGGIAGAVVLGIVAMGALALVQRTRTRRQQLAVVAPNLRHAEAQGLPEARSGPARLDPEDGFGRLVGVEGAGAGQTWEFSATPARIGSGAECEVRLAAAPDVAPQHAAIWMRDGKIMLRHTGGPRRPTLVGGRPVDWVILDSGDEFSVGGHRWRAEVREGAEVR